ncbi:hypothetical protein K6Y31_20875 [Motilimonas cestriensis]|uniref:HTH cro/C1-type domain-containing protein n=1 Tax=Motilimonas cestriensis TaxID=2742685 RepID=A0ABS8WHJ2_9GAMM|nr:DUF3693 domain-containing protein [Motilimonas cestriensis]MCE2597231.1 hypothetical protein [Motilimonas cestriensis]
MYSKQLIDKYKAVKKLNTDSEVAKSMNFSKTHISEIKRGVREFTDETAIYIAKECGLDVDLVLVTLAMERAKTKESKSAWQHLVKKFSEQRYAVQSLFVAGFALFFTDFSNCALCILC